MSRLSRSLVAALAAAQVILAGCADPSATGPESSPAMARAAVGGGDAAKHLVNMMDACDPTTFNEALRDPTACLRSGGVTFQRFLAELR
ncbi:MAG: hypothetical protein ACJ8AO_19600, partial [Gemmatimonadaceae bacterium]